MGQKVQFTVPLVAPSVNHCVKHTRKGRHYVSEEAKAFKAAVVLFAAGQKVRAPAYSVQVVVLLAKGQKGDVDNFAKCVLDSLVDAEVIDTDAKVYSLLLRKSRDITNPRTIICVEGNE